MAGGRQLTVDSAKERVLLGACARVVDELKVEGRAPIDFEKVARLVKREAGGTAWVVSGGGREGKC